MKPRPFLFVVGERVMWVVPRHAVIHRGTVVRVVPHGTYPLDVMAGRLRGCRYRGWWRPHESYVVEDAKGRHWWPRVTHLRHADD